MLTDIISSNTNYDNDDDSDVYVLGWYYTVMIMIRKLFRYLTVVVVVKV